ncbi:MAG: DUF1116 domain-containing protein [Candidatus Micrarchaeia archaeon]
MSISEDIENANRKAFDIMNRGKAILIDFDYAGKVIPGMKENTILHAGPPIEYADMIEPMKAAVQGALVFEGKARNLEEADRMARRGDFEFKPCHEMQSVGPMAGITTSGMYVAVVENPEFGNRAYCNLHEGRGKVLRFGANGKEVLDRLTWMNEKLGPALKEVVNKKPVDLKSIVAEAVQMGDELHQRSKASSLIFLSAISERLLDLPDGAEIFKFIAAREQFFLNLAMPAMKALADPADGIKYSTLVTRMTRNGVNFGIQVSGLKGKWFTSEVEPPIGLFFAGFSQNDASGDFGDSAIMETLGLGGLSSAAAPSVTRFIGGSVRDAISATEQGYKITYGQSRDILLPIMDFKGIPLGIDIIKVNETNILPTINTGIAHRQAGIGQIGGGISHPPLKVFNKALKEFAKTYGL